MPTLSLQELIIIERYLEDRFCELSRESDLENHNHCDAMWRELNELREHIDETTA